MRKNIELYLRAHFSLRFPKRATLTSNERILITKRLALYLRAGMPLMEALDVLLTDAKLHAERRLLTELTDGARKGMRISQVLNASPFGFPIFHRYVIEAGELSGTLSDAFAHVADLGARRAALQRTLLTALAYPALILCSTFALSGFLIVWAFPKILPLFKGLHVALPLTTRLLIAISTFLRSYGLYILGGWIILTGIAFKLVKIEGVRKRIDATLSTFPVLGSSVRNHSIATSFRMLHVLLRSGVRLDAALVLIQASAWNRTYRASFADMRETVLSGSPCTAHMRANPQLYSSVTVQLIAAGERTGSLSESAQLAAEIADDALEYEMRTRTAFLEPLLMVFMGFVVGTVALAIISPMYALTQNLGLH